MCKSLILAERDAAVAKCRSCRHCIYRPAEYGKRIAYDTETIRCTEGVFGLPPERHYKFRQWVGDDSLFSFPLWTGALARANNKTRRLILLCQFYCPKEEVGHDDALLQGGCDEG